ncbi:MAG: BON domain-containing protein [Desulfovibrionales bacterium]|nr:BON domain-containing protein [Desulfovibrionales bacterium]
MKHSALSLVLAALLAFASAGCAVTRDQSTVGAYIDDSVITTQVKAKFANDKQVSAMAISVETLKGVVQISGFAKNAQEKSRAGELARSTEGVKSVVNNIVVKP